MSALVPPLAARIARHETAQRRRHTMERLARSIASVGGKLPGAMVNPPTITVGSVSNVTDLPQPHVHFAPLVDGALSPRMAFLAGDWGPSPFPVPAGFVSPWGPHRGDGTDANARTNRVSLQNGAIEFSTAAPDLVIVSNTLGARYHLLIDGEYAFEGSVVDADQTRQNTRLRFGDGSSAHATLRHYRIVAGSGFSFEGVKCSALYPPFAERRTDRLKIVLHGDSFAEGTGSSPAFRHPSMSGVLAQLLGQHDTRCSAIGSTGFVWNGAGYNNALQRVESDIVEPGFDVVIDTMGVNDGGFVNSDPANEAVLEAAVEGWLAKVRRGLPDAPVFMTGPMSPRSPTGAPSTVHAVKKRVAARWATQGVHFIDNADEDRWVTGSGYAGNPKGDGNADWVTGGATGTDQTHPTPAGHVYLARRIAQGIARSIAKATASAPG